MTTATIDFTNEFALSEQVKDEIAQLLATCFPGTKYFGRHYFKQLPHSRLVVSNEGKTIGQVGMDYRAMNLNGKLIKVLGVIDLAVHPDHQGKGLGTTLMSRLDDIADANKNSIDFLFLVTGQQAFYERLGYQNTTQTVSWMRINDNRNQGMGNAQMNDCFLMYKKVSAKDWEDGELDMLGYRY